MLELGDRSSLDGVNPAFTEHGFDPQNKFTRPWRWTPYVFYAHRNEQGKPAVFEFREWNWSTDEHSLWPADWDLLLGMQTHLQGKSANAGKPETLAKELEGLKERLKDRAVPEEECWKALLEGKIQRTFLPASLRFMQAEDPGLKDVDWFIPPRGTLTQFDHLAVPAAALQKEAAAELIQFLLQAEQQNGLIKESGYFPVKSLEGHECDFTPVNSANLQQKLTEEEWFKGWVKGWFNATEFLVDKPPLPAVDKPVPAAAPPEQAAPAK